MFRIFTKPQQTAKPDTTTDDLIAVTNVFLAQFTANQNR